VSLLRIQDLRVQIARQPLVQGVTLDVERGELFGLIGPNGAGKSTLVKAIAQLMSYSGQIWLEDRPLQRMPALTRARRIAYLSQDDRLQWPISVRDLVALGRHPYRGSWWRGERRSHARDEDADQRAIDDAMRATDVFTLRDRRADELSGGERARARMARVLAVGADLLLADEPVAALDPMHQLRVMQLLKAQCQAGRAVLVVLHDLTLASRFCDRLLLLDEGLPVAAGDVATVLSADNLRRVYRVQAIIGEHDDTDGAHRYIVPWACTPDRVKAHEQSDCE
jgi:iron complex transport system ATP-binding protein